MPTAKSGASAEQQRPRRTRIVGPQSKTGCFTCKARRIKCDEEKPTCLRCVRSGRRCEGFPTTLADIDDKTVKLAVPAERGSSSQSMRGLFLFTSAPSYALVDGLPGNPQQSQYARLGCRVLKHDGYEHFGFGNSIWQYLLPQLSHAVPSVNAAAAALGAVYELRLLASQDIEAREILAAAQYDAALRYLQRDVARQPYGPVPVLLACALLACAEVLQNRQNNALTHIQGAFLILRNRSMSCAPVNELHDDHPPVHGLASDERDDYLPPMDDIATLFYALDIHTASYTLYRPPDLPMLDSRLNERHLSSMETVNDARLLLVPLLHSCYHFTAEASIYKYLPRHSIRPGLFVEQGRHLAQLSLWLAKLEHDILSACTGTTTKVDAQSYTHALVLRIQCLSTIIYASTVLSPYEAEYDKHASLFQQIVTDVMAALRGTSTTRTDLGRFCPGLGVIQPLFFTAMKYRHSKWRRFAINLLRNAGREGPFDGSLLATVAMRAVQIEEADSAMLEVNDPVPDHVKEGIRLHGCGMAVEAEDKPANVVTVMFSQCRDVDVMLSSKLWEDDANWKIWYEDLTFPFPHKSPFHQTLHTDSPFLGLSPQDGAGYSIIAAPVRPPKG